MASPLDALKMQKTPLLAQRPTSLIVPKTNKTDDQLAQHHTTVIPKNTKIFGAHFFGTTPR
jgi:hypothetical protein